MKKYTPLDDSTMAAYIAGTLPVERRQAVVLSLVQNVDDREVLRMACEALVAIRVDSRQPSKMYLVRGGASVHPKQPDRPALPNEDRTYRFAG